MGGCIQYIRAHFPYQIVISQQAFRRNTKEMFHIVMMLLNFAHKRKQRYGVIVTLIIIIAVFIGDLHVVFRYVPSPLLLGRNMQ